MHEGVSCDMCGESPLRGVRYRCSMCPDYDVCDRCVLLPAVPNVCHDGSHLFLRIATPSAEVSSYTSVMNRAALQHVGVRCNGCNATDFRGFRFKCQLCPNVDLCEACEARGQHDPSHNRIKMGSLDPFPAAQPDAGFTAARPQAAVHTRASGLPLCQECRGGGTGAARAVDHHAASASAEVEAARMRDLCAASAGRRHCSVCQQQFTGLCESIDLRERQ
jgi:hypothetical protein